VFIVRKAFVFHHRIIDLHTAHSEILVALRTFSLKRLSIAEIMASLEKPSVSPQQPATPPGSPTSLSFPQSITVDDLRRLVVGLIKEAQKAESIGKAQTIASVPEKDITPSGPRARASRLEFRTVDER
jgi:hypothetical protein